MYSQESSSAVWKYFLRSKCENEMVCKLCEKKPCRTCKKDFPCKLKGMYDTNGKKHLKCFHPTEYEEIEKT